MVMGKTTENHKQFMQMALNEARKGAGKVSPNPMVGCVIVSGGKVISTGYHPCFGGPHSEVVALTKVKGSLKDATMYLTLEPCCHTRKKTPPCVPLVLKSGIRNLVIAMKDPNPAVSGRGIKILRKNGIKCVIGVLENEARELNKPYIKWVTRQLPYVTLKWAMSLDGKIAARGGDSMWISSKESRSQVHALRAQTDAILVGIGTVLKDNPYLTAHGKGRNPLRLVIDPELKIPLNSNVLNEQAKTIVFYDKSKEKLLNHKLNKIGETTHKTVGLRTNKNGHVYLKELVKYLASERTASLLIEGGGHTNAQALEQRIVDEIIAYVSPIVIGGRDAVTPVEGLGSKTIEKSIKFVNWVVSNSGPDFKITARLDTRN